MPKIVVLRLGHRPQRDKRVTTHVALVARAFGADGIILTTRDSNIERSINKVTELWGGPFFIRSGESWRKIIQDWRSEGGSVLHLTMFGLPLDEVLPRLQDKNLLVVVGAEKVPGEIFELADFNVAITNQPHSEVGALAVLLDRIFSSFKLKKKLFGGRLMITPSDKGKKVKKVP